MTDQHKETFKIEARELLADLETALLELEDNIYNEEIIGRIFRALHTIKGSGSMFGYDDIAIFTHNIENVYDRIRNGELKVNSEIIDLTLSAGDCIKAMLNEIKVDEGEIQNLVTSFRALSAETEKKELSEVHCNVDNNSEESFHISFQPSSETFMFGSNPILLIRELSELGSIQVTANADSIPKLDQFNPEECLIKWEIILQTNKGENAVKDVFIFVEDCSKLIIEKIEKTVAVTKKENPRNVSMPEDKVSSIRVNSDKLDNLVNLVGELVTVQARLSQYAAAHGLAQLNSISEEVERLTWELRDSALNIRMLPIGTTFSRFKRLVRDLSNQLNKKVELITEGAETELDKTVIERLNDPLVHIIRNSIDHGIEFPENRIAKGKSETGRIKLCAQQSGGNVIIKIIDDGAGIDKNAVRKKAIENGIITQDAELRDNEIYSLIFAPGFSTADAVTNISGRGVGMDVVKRALEELKGNVEVTSKPDEGTVITLKLPLTLAIIEGLLVQVNDDHFIIPLNLVEECVELTPNDKAASKGRDLAFVRGEIVPYIPLRERFGIITCNQGIEQIVIVNNEGFRIGFVVDKVIGEHQTVIKSLGSCFRKVQGVSGATVLGDGTVALILDVPHLIQMAEESERSLLG